MRILLYKPSLDLRHIRKQAYEHLSSEYSVFCQVAHDILDKLPLNTETVTASQFSRDGYNHAFIYKNKGLFSLAMLHTDEPTDNILVEIFFSKDIQSMIEYYKELKYNN